jgi:hypothetical protein
MSDEPRRLVQVGIFPTSGEIIFVDGVNPVRRMIAEASAKARRRSRRRGARLGRQGRRCRAREVNEASARIAAPKTRLQSFREDDMTFALIPSSGRSRVASAAALLRDALNELYTAQREEAGEQAKRAERLERDARAREAVRQAEAARRPHLALIDKHQVRVFADAVMGAARSRDRSSVEQIERLLVAFVDEVEKTGANG